MSGAIPRQVEEMQGVDLEGGLAYQLYPDLLAWRSVLKVLRVPLERSVLIAADATLNGTTFAAELLASGAVGEEALYRALASELGLRFAEDVDPERIILQGRQCVTLLRDGAGGRPVKFEDGAGQTGYLFAPEGFGLAELRSRLSRWPQLRRRIWLTTPRRLRAALLARSAHLLIEAARNDLVDKHPGLSARTVATGAQGGLIGASLVCLAVAFLEAPVLTFGVMHILTSLFFLACVGLRFAAVRALPEVEIGRMEPISRSELPRYSVLIALLREAEVVPQLLDALLALDWPRSKLDIQLICEADDAGTIAAIHQCSLPSHVELVLVPPGAPRTKPKALSFALPLARGEFVVLYDAEDRPEPGQLMEAWRRFSISGPGLACLQAPLEVTNGGEGWIARQFAFEYAALFRGLLPFLSGRNVVLPLGGTSNHFRRSVLEEVGGWDPYNVTEDADIGVRCNAQDQVALDDESREKVGTAGKRRDNKGLRG